ncbi:MAG TPA: coproporphyrinogen III oxidase [Alphaproteobacteria bacterium]|nr:coproporphyrinogen III oxidase [Alphaproteobacteria bacterium]HAJ47972.1 coproporphyrinogen III oxidase [Alphaproteobacteria bacterium]
MSGDPGFGIYVHWPFCAAKCPYCDFNSHVRLKIDETRWLAATLRELAQMAGRLDRRPRTVSSVFFGGGTPSLMTGGSVQAILERIAHHFPIDRAVEVTLEANPTSVEAQRFRDYRAAGVNRASLGVQALDDEALRSLGRLHTKAEAMAAVTLAVEIFPRVSFDLIYARPKQTTAAWNRELAEALSYGPTHLSVYQLTFEEGTPFEALRQAGKMKPLDDDTSAEQYRLSQEMLDAAGLPAYEISNHAKPGDEARHNLLYWRYGEYLGLGPGAHGRVWIDGQLHATETVKLPEAWAQKVEAEGAGLTVCRPVASAQQAEEALLMGMRLTEGVSLDRIAHLRGRALDPARLADLVQAGLVVIENDTLRAAPEGRLVLNAILAQLARD